MSQKNEFLEKLATLVDEYNIDMFATTDGTVCIRNSETLEEYFDDYTSGDGSSFRAAKTKNPSSCDIGSS